MLHIKHGILAIIVPLFINISGVSAQVLQNLGPTPRIGGITVQCMGIPTVVVGNLSDIAYAIPGRIMLHPEFFAQPSHSQVFIYAHECAHQMPHIGSNEAAADCWAIRLLRNQGLLNPAQANDIARALYFSPGSWTHAPGPQRVSNMVRCYNSP